MLFIGLPEDFRRAHNTALSHLSLDTTWIAGGELPKASSKIKILVLGLDHRLNQAPAYWEKLRHTFPQADIVAISSKNSAAFAMNCLHEGFSDFLAQPVSPDELALCLLRSRQRFESMQSGPVSADADRSLTQISACTSISTLRLRTCGALARLLNAQQVQWLAKAPRPRKKSAVVLPCRKKSHGVFLIEGLPKKINSVQNEQAAALVQHAELTFLNLKHVEKLKRQTFIDDLTGLYNYRYLQFALEASASDWELNKHPFAVLFIDVDRFKLVNDRHGHLVGSEFLTALGKVIKNAVRTIDWVFRYGGDEFVILLRETAPFKAAQIAERLRNQIENRTFLIRNTRLKATLSIGIASYPEHTKSVQRLIELADSAMYQAKKTRNRVCVALPKRPRLQRRARPEPSL